jgi:replicative DNA helicase
MNAARKAKPIPAADPTEFEDPFTGGVPSSVLDSEGVFLSACLLQPEKFAIIGYMLEPHHFYADANRRVFEALRALYSADASEGRAVAYDVVLVANYMRDHGTLKQVGGMPYLATLCDAQPATLNPGQHAAAIREAWKRRELMVVLARCATLLRNNEASHSDCYDELKEHFRSAKNG